MQARANGAKVSAAPPVVVAAKAEPQKLPEIPAAIKGCMETNAAKKGTADQIGADYRAKQKCWSDYVKWYNDRQKSAVAPDGHPKTAGKKDKGSGATWE